MRIFIGSVATETNTFCAFPTRRSAFEEHGISRRASFEEGSIPGGLLRIVRERAEADGHIVAEGLSAFAQPAGRVEQAVYEVLRDGLLADLDAAGPVDVVLLLLHGAMVAEGEDDCEGDILTRVRAARPDAVIGVELDPHCHLSATMAEAADLIVIGKLFPHTDLGTCASQLYDLAMATARGEIRPVGALVDTRMIGFYPTTGEPMAGFVADMAARETGRVLSCNLVHGFPWADVPDVGTRVLVYADGDAALASHTARQLASALYEQRKALRYSLPAFETALDGALAHDGLTVLGDACDNPGGGAAGDSTFALRALIARGVKGAVFGALWDPEAAERCALAGVGARLPVRLGGASGPLSGDPLDLEVEVMGAARDYTSGVFAMRQAMGTSVWLRAHGIDIVVCSIRAQTYAADTFTGLGITLADKRLAVVKSAIHYKADFARLSRACVSVATPGALRVDFEAIAYTRREEAFYPRIDDPWAAGEPEARIYPAHTRQNGNTLS